MFFNVLDEPRQILLKKIVKASPVPDSYLAGGTALALLLGHRQSIDFDWFTPVDFDPAALADRLDHMIKSLAFFDDAEQEAFPMMLRTIDWSEVKEFFSNVQKELLRELIDPSARG